MKIGRWILWLTILTITNLLGYSVAGQENIHRVTYDNISFTFPSFLATGVKIETVAANPLTLPEEQFWAGTYPEHTRFDFLNYLDGTEFRPPYLIEGAQLLVYSTRSMREFGYDFVDQPTALNVMLKDRPDLSTYVGVLDGRSEEGFSLPFLPWLNSSQMLRTHPQYVEIPGAGSGIRYMTRFSQEADHVTDQQILYTFQGIMADGSYYVSAVFPVKTGVLPEEVDTSNIDWDNFGANYGTYLAETFSQIDIIPNEAFYPSLNMLDALIQSIDIEKVTPSWQTYTDIAAGYRFQYPSNRQICVFENVVELIPNAGYFDNPEADHCTLAYQANPISIIFGEDDDAFQSYRLENHPGSFVDYQEETLNLVEQPATRISGKEVETGLSFELFRFEHNGSYLIFRAIGEENISILNEIIATSHFINDSDS